MLCEFQGRSRSCICIKFKNKHSLLINESNYSDEFDEETKQLHLLVKGVIILNLINLTGNKCPECDSKITSVLNLNMAKGLCDQFQLTCTNCNWSRTIELLDNNKIGKQYDINIHSIMAFRETGKGYAALESFYYKINISPSMTKNNYDTILDNLHEPYVLTGKESMQNAAFIVKKNYLLITAIVNEHVSAG